MCKDKQGNQFWEIPLGWNSIDNHRLRVTENCKGKTIRLNKVDSNNKVYPGPEPSIEMIPELIEKLIHVYNMHHPKNQ